MEGSSRKTVIHIKAGAGEMVIFRELLQYSFLILDAVGIALYPIILAETAVQGGFPDLV